MKKKTKFNLIFLALLLSMILLIGCRNNKNANPTATPKLTQPVNTAPISSIIPTIFPTGTAVASPGASPDMNTTASIVNTTDAFEKAISKDGTWIICLLNDLTVNKDLVLEGEFTNGKKDTAGKDIIQRKIALYTQDENRNITNRFTLTAPKLTIKSPNASIQHGTFKGDLYVSVKDFELVDTTVNGNVYFTSNDAKSTFKMDEDSKVTGKQELKQ